jgi:hypothetical protein
MPQFHTLLVGLNWLIEATRSSVNVRMPLTLLSGMTEKQICCAA